MILTPEAERVSNKNGGIKSAVCLLGLFSLADD